MRDGIRRLEAALVDHPDHSEGHYILGYTHLQLGDAEAAIPALEAAIRLEAEIPERLNTLAQAYEAARRDPATITRLYQQALRLQPALADIRLNYGRFLESQARLPEAMRQYQLAIDEAPWLALAHYNLGTGHLQLQDYAAAEASLRDAIQLQPIYPEALGNLGLMYAIQDQPETARTWFEQAVEVAPGNAVALGNLGAFYLNTGAIDEAIALLTRAVEADPQYVDALANLAQAYVNNDELIRARDYAQRALQINPNHPLARQILAVL